MTGERSNKAHGPDDVGPASDPHNVGPSSADDGAPTPGLPHEAAGAAGMGDDGDLFAPSEEGFAGIMARVNASEQLVDYLRGELDEQTAADVEAVVDSSFALQQQRDETAEVLSRFELWPASAAHPPTPGLPLEAFGRS